MNRRAYLGRRKLAAAALALSALLSTGSAVTIDRADAAPFQCGILSSGTFIWTEWRNGVCDHIGYGWATTVLAQDPTGQYKAVFNASGNLYVQRWDGLVIWESYTYAPAGILYFQYDGNVMLYRNGQPYWCACNYFGAYGTMRFVMQTDGNLVTYNGAWRPYWSTFSGTLYS